MANHVLTTTGEVEITNVNNPELRCTRKITKVTSRSIHTSFGEILKKSDGWRYRYLVTQ